MIDDEIAVNLRPKYPQKQPEVDGKAGEQQDPLIQRAGNSEAIPQWTRLMLEIMYKIFGTYDFPYEFALIRPCQMTMSINAKINHFHRVK
ncbi:MAG: hypothetical protein EZS28_039624 [Streblomastix strix]|uniref:Uncharacterized protein n=1 Tax=Streblomastix strix TaxID=222440 RepID=A0A5J4U3E0_9EUKA|nr:MAG: hypothetical protein EZS28_039624 [Streblomastix strix]